MLKEAYPNLSKIAALESGADWPELSPEQSAQLKQQAMRMLKFVGAGAGVGGLGGLLAQLLRKPENRNYLRDMLIGGVAGGAVGGGVGQFGLPNVNVDIDARDFKKRLPAGLG